MAAMARLNDTSNHGGTIISASGNVRANGRGVARLGDLHSCPLTGHGITAIVSTPSGVGADSHRIATVGAVCGCGAVIITGSPSVGA